MDYVTNLNEVALYMEQKGMEYRTIDKGRAGRIYAEIKSHIALPKCVIQILGTNGKGSTGRFIAQILAQNGYKILHFTSPHIFSFSERFYTNCGQNCGIVCDENLINAHRFLQKFAIMSECSYFEYATFLALVLAQNADYAILEAGVGGELDSTSVVERDLCVFSVIDYDHTEILGDCIESIATTKLNAVFYPNKVPKMLLGMQKYEIVEKIAKDIAKKHKVEFFALDSRESSVDSANLSPTFNLKSLIFSQKGCTPHPAPPTRQKLRFSLLGGEPRLSASSKKSAERTTASFESDFLHHEAGEIKGASHGFNFDLDCFDSTNLAMTIESYLAKHHLVSFLAQNLALALKAVQIFGINANLNALPKLDLQGRFEQIADNIIIDVGHNQNAAFAIKQNLKSNKVILVYNSYFQKNIYDILDILKDNILRVEILRVENNPRIIDQSALESILQSLNIAYKNFSAIDSTQKYLVFGSFSVVETFMRIFCKTKIKANQ